MKIISHILPHEAYKQIQEGAILVDVRERDEVSQCVCDVAHILIAPMSQFETCIKDISKDQKIITMCHSGGRSAYAAEMLSTLGYKDITNLSGGIIAWQAAGLPIK